MWWVSFPVPYVACWAVAVGGLLSGRSNIDRGKQAGRLADMGHHRVVTQTSISLQPDGVAQLISRAREVLRSSGVRSVGWVLEEGRLLLAAAVGPAVELFELSGDQLVPHGVPAASRYGGVVKSVAWVREGSRLLLAVSSLAFRPGFASGLDLFELVGGQLTPYGAPATSRFGGVHSVAWVREGNRLLLVASVHSGSREAGVVELFELSGDRLTPCDNPTTSRIGGVQSVAWVREGNRVLLAAGCLGSDGHLGGVELYELTGNQLTAYGEPATSRIGGVQSVAWVREGNRVLLAAGCLGDEGTLGGVELFELSGDQLIPYDNLATSRFGQVQSVGWVWEQGRLLLAAGTTHGGAGRVELFELLGDQLIPYGDPATPRVGRVAIVGWVMEGSRLLLAVGGTGRVNGGGVALFELVEERRSARLPAYRSDAAKGADELARTGEAQALAELLTAASAHPPLAVGVFGEWGQGKSHFLELLRAQVDAVARPGNPLAVCSVRQVQFNAWHYAETGLWPSLVAELFAQLAAPADGVGPGGAQRSLSALSARLVAERQLPQRLLAAQERLRELTRAARRVRATTWEALTPAERAELVRQAGGEQSAARLYAEALGGAVVLRETLFLWRQAVVGMGWRRTAGFLVVCAVAAGGAVTMAWAWPWVPRWTAALPVLAPALIAVTAAGRQAAKARTRVVALGGKLRQLLDRQRSEIDAAARLAAEEVAALQRQMQDLTAAGQLAGLVEDRAAVTDYRSRLGVMTHIREDFERMAVLLAQASEQRLLPDADGLASPGPYLPDSEGGAGVDAAGDTLPAVDRIVLYIDDLDRCPPGRVVEMLEAIHLLLAVDLFVVVVAIDPRWLLAAIAAHYRDVLHSDTYENKDGSEPGASSPAQYLEKIFQVVFTLPALHTDGYRQLLRSMIAVRDPDGPQSAAPPTRRETLAPDSAPGPKRWIGKESGQEEEDGPPDPVPHVSWARIVEHSDPLTLEAEELHLLDLLGPPLMVADPRAAKRLANSYGLLTALRRDERDSDLAEHTQPGASVASSDATYRPYRAGMVLLAALVAYPACGPALCLQLHQASLDTPQAGWREFCEHLSRPDQNHGMRATSGPQSQLRRLGQALLYTTDRAAQESLALPQTLQPWQQWVIPVARLSFPAGQAVAALHRQERRELLPDGNEPPLL